MIIWLIQVKDGKLLDEMTVSFTGLANKVGLADPATLYWFQNQSPVQRNGSSDLVPEYTGPS